MSAVLAPQIWTSLGAPFCWNSLMTRNMRKSMAETIEVTLLMFISHGCNFLVRHGFDIKTDDSKMVRNLTSLAEYLTFGLQDSPVTTPMSPTIMKLETIGPNKAMIRSMFSTQTALLPNALLAISANDDASFLEPGLATLDES